MFGIGKKPTVMEVKGELPKAAKAKPKKAPPQNMAIRLSSTDIFAGQKREKGIFDPSKSFPSVVPFWTKEKKRLI